MSDNRVWVFHAEGARFSGGVFTTRESAERWIRTNELTGVLTAYPLDRGVFDWAREEGYFAPKKLFTAGMIGGFTSAHQEHYHYTRGVTGEDE